MMAYKRTFCSGDNDTDVVDDQADEDYSLVDGDRRGVELLV